jgi:glutamyl/glutaminyl-tRNA synthetase
MAINVARAPTDRDRFAPSPTGPLYLGSLPPPFGNWLLARAE